jgi:hypothetical protein
MPHSIADEFKSIPMSSNLGESLERAHRFARDQGHRLVALEHLLLALSEDPEAALILQAANVDLARLRADVSGHLGRLLDDMRAEPGTEPRPDPELLRVLQAAASAAQQSKRKQIDGAIVLAAIVGDGKSAAAGTLKAHGMTFEEAIRALQRANTQARLKTPAKPAGAPAAAKAPEAGATAPPSEPRPSEPANHVEAQTADTASLSARLASHANAADDILAAARARIQQRSAGPGSHADPDIAPAPTSHEPPAYQVEEAPRAPGASEPPQESSNAFEELLAVSTASRSESAPGPDAYPDSAQEPAGARGPRQSWTPPPDMRPQPNARHPQAPAGRAPPPRGPRPDDGQRQPPQLGARQGTAPGPMPGNMPVAGLPNRPARAPWPEPAEHNGQARPQAANGSFAGPHYADAGGPLPGPSQSPRSAPAQRSGSQPDRGPLVESVPRRMRVGVASKAEVRISRDRIEALVVALNGHGMPHRPEQFLARALSVRLKAPNGGFYIEPASPETQWVERTSAHARDEHAIWRWTVTPQRRGRGRLLLMVSARTVGHDGLPAESAPPDRLIEVRVSPNRMRGLGRWLAWLTALAIGAAVGRFSDQLWTAASALIKKMLDG